ncbi:hypothetical protein BGZ73_007011 [Actinomortierella ambigua]|nr:hypothetical protein BGZ73_007011 [Actinomortierella ambigua]
MAHNDSRSSQPRLDLDCMTAVIDNVKDHPTLLSLLTVSKDVFHIAVKKLYRSWLFWPRYSREGAELFVRFILSLSPVDDELTMALRNHLQIQWPREPPPTVDYLSLVPEMTFHPLYTCNWAVSVPSSSTPVMLSRTKLRCLLMWAICGHRLSSVEAIRFEDSEELELFSKHAKQLTSLRRIALGSYWDGVWIELQSFIRAYSACHGEAVRRLSFEFGQGPQLSTTIVETMASLCPPPPPREIRGYNLAHCAAHLHQMDFGRVRLMFVDHSAYAEQADLWSQLLPKCTSLQHLDMRGLRHIEVHGRYHAKRIFQWAVQERRAGRSLAPLKAVKLKFRNYILYQTVNDLLEGFGPTLEAVKIKCDWDDHWLTMPSNMSQPRLASGLHLPNLRTLEARVFSPYVFTFNPDHMPIMPRLQVLKLDQVNLHLDILPGLAAQPENVDNSLPLRVWPLCEFPQLRVLCLTGRSAAEFNPQCLQTMSCLEELTMVLDKTGNWIEDWPAGLWTWDWELPALKKLALGQLMATAFRFRSLCFMPMLESVTLGGINDRDTDFHVIFDLPIDMIDECGSGDGMDEEGGARDDCNTGLEHSGGSAPYTNGYGLGSRVVSESVTSIEVGCREVTIAYSTWRKLLSARAFPNLRSMYIGGYAGVYETDVLRGASRHPGLRELWLAKPENAEYDWPADKIDEAWEFGVGRVDEDGQLLFHANHGCYRIPKETVPSRSHSSLQ